MKSINAKKHLVALFHMIFVLIVLNVGANAATFTVTTVNDGLGINSLREAINQANSTSDATFTITFNIGAGGVKTITPGSALPAINPTTATTIIIDATTMPGYAGAPLLQLNGAFAGAGSHGLVVNKGNVTVRGLIINSFAQYGIYMACPGGICTSMANLNVSGCYIGTDASGTTPMGNGNGIRIQARQDAAGFVTNIGGPAANQRNVISGNISNGIVFDSPFSDFDINIVNNYIGTNAAGTAAIPNGANGIFIFDSIPGGAMRNPDVYIGGANANQRNVISGNTLNGIRVTDNTLDIYAKGNYIGTNATGTVDLGNGANGILADGGTSFYPIVIGGTAAGEGNTISGNNEDGIRNELAVISIEGNRIGTNAGGTAAVPNTDDGVYVAEVNLFGSTTCEGNTISGNGDDGVEIAANSSAILLGNRIGVNASGTAALPNADDGVTVMGTTVIGGSIASEKNIIGGNTGDGVIIQNSSKIYGNYIGTNASGADLGNGGDGVRLLASVTNVEIGTTTTGEGNVIAFNNGDGVELVPGFGGAAPHEIDIRGNSIYSNSGLGIDLGPTSGVTPNDLNDADTGPNGLQNFPVLQMAAGNFIQGSLNSEADKDFEINFYRVDTCDASGHGEGRYYLGSTSVSTNAGGNVNFNAAGFSLVAGQIITATASKRTNFTDYSTSEFSQCLTVSPPPGEVKLSSATYGASESNASVAIIVSRNNGSTGTITVNYATANGTATAGQDYTTTSGTLTFANGETGKLLSIPIINDTKDEPDETLTITLSNPTGGAQLVNPSTAVLTIADNDDPPNVSVSDISHVEGNENLTAFDFTVSLSEASAFAASVNWQTAAGTANAVVDYQTNGGTVNFAAGETTKQITVQVYGETVVEINETFNVNLSAPTMTTIGDGNGIGTIQDDDNPGKFSFSIAPYNTGEGDGFAVATVIRTGGDAGTATVDYATTGGGTASPMADFTPVSDTLMFLDGEVQKTFAVAILEDQITEQTESVNLILSNPTGGASLGLAGAVINLIDNDSGTPLAISGTVKLSDDTPLANVQMSLQGSQSLTTTTDANGAFNFTGLNPNGNYTVTPSIIGYIFNPINHEYLNLSESVTNANFTAAPALNRTVRVVGGDAVPGQTAEATAELVAQGDENSVAFSMQFNPGVLSNPQVALGADAQAASLIVNDSQAAQGRIGVVLALPAGESFTAGTKKLTVITFNTAQTNEYGTPLDFGNLPTVSETANVNADPLPTIYTNGTITFAQGLEGDVSPRSTGNGAVTVADFTQIGRFVAGLNAFDNPSYNEFQRADIAPRISKGNGGLTVSDYTQAGRYAAGLDPLQTAGGATQPSLLQEFKENDAMIFVGPPRTIRIVNASSSPGQQVSLPIEIDAIGDENGFGFSLSYDPTKLGSPVVEVGAGVPINAALFSNTNQTGKVGVVLALPAGITLTTGTKHLVTVRFNVAQTAPAGQIPIIFGDTPVFREVVNSNADVLQAEYSDGAIRVLGPTAARVNVGGRITDVSGHGVGGVGLTITDPAGISKRAISNPFGYYHFSDMPVGLMYTVLANSRRFHFSPPNQVVMVLDEVNDVDFTAEMNE